LAAGLATSPPGRLRQHPQRPWPFPCLRTREPCVRCRPPARPPHTDDRPTHPPPLRARPRPPACVCVRLASLAPTHPHRVVSHVSLPPSVGSVGFLSLSLSLHL
jgi:hypothetical protein